jgi:hypothetical protein
MTLVGICLLGFSGRDLIHQRRIALRRHDKSGRGWP